MQPGKKIKINSAKQCSHWVLQTACFYLKEIIIMASSIFVESYLCRVTFPVFKFIKNSSDEWAQPLIHNVQTLLVFYTPRKIQTNRAMWIDGSQEAVYEKHAVCVWYQSVSHRKYQGSLGRTVRRCNGGWKGDVQWPLSYFSPSSPQLLKNCWNRNYFI